MRARIAALAAAALAFGLTAPATADEIPDDVTVPLSRLEFTTVQAITYPRSLLTYQSIEVADAPRDELLELFEAEDSPDGTVLTMPDRVLFDFGSAELRSSSLDRLSRLLRLLEGTSGTITVRGHTDDIGTDAANQTLSEERAQAVADHLAGNGIDAGRITTEGLAAREPVAPNRNADGDDDPEGRQRNRRVEVVVELD